MQGSFNNHKSIDTVTSAEFIKIMLAAVTNKCKISVVSHRKVPHSQMMHVLQASSEQLFSR